MWFSEPENRCVIHRVAAPSVATPVGDSELLKLVDCLVTFSACFLRVLPGSLASTSLIVCATQFGVSRRVFGVPSSVGRFNGLKLDLANDVCKYEIKNSTFTDGFKIYYAKNLVACGL